jgi:hypothetical protein
LICQLELLRKDLHRHHPARLDTTQLLALLNFITVLHGDFLMITLSHTLLNLLLLLAVVVEVLEIQAAAAVLVVFYTQHQLQ